MSLDVIVPVYKPEEKKLERLIQQLNRQTRRPDHVFFLQTLVDEEEDQRVETILDKAENAQIFPIKKEDFDHGGTRNYGAGLSQADYLLFMTQDAVPVDENLLASMESFYEQDPLLAVVYARQLPSREVGPIERFTRLFNYPKESRIKGLKDLDTLGIKTYFCSNVCALYKKKTFDYMGGFVESTIFNEDMIYAAGAVKAGFKIGYQAQAKVIHAHKYTYRQQLSRNFDLAVSQKDYEELFADVKSEKEGIKLVKLTIRYLNQTGRWYLIPDLILQSGFKYIGYWLGKHYRSLPKKMIKKISMNPKYWDSERRMDG